MADSGERMHRFQSAFFRRLGDDHPLVDLFDHLPAVYFFIKDDAGRFVHVNRTLCEVLGVDASQIVGKTDDDFFLPELAARYRAEDREVMDTGRTISGRVWLVPDQAGTLRWFLSSKSPLTDRTGRPIGIAGAMQDIDKSGAVLAPYEQLGEVVAHISRHYAERLRLTDLARRAHLSVSQLTRRFKQQFGMTPARYIRRVRLNAACRLLAETDLDLDTVAEHTGFYDASHFVKQFKSELGQTPHAYRQRITHKAE